MGIPPLFPAQQRYEEFVKQFRAEQEEREKRLRKEFEDLREERKIGLQKWALGVSLAALLSSLLFGIWNSKIAYKSLSTARRGFVTAHPLKVSENNGKVTFEIRATPPNPALHISVMATCGRVDESMKPENVMNIVKMYENNLTLAPSEFRQYTCDTKFADDGRTFIGSTQTVLTGTIRYADLAGDYYYTNFCYSTPESPLFSEGTEFLGCSTLNDAQ